MVTLAHSPGPIVGGVWGHSHTSMRSSPIQLGKLPLSSLLLGGLKSVTCLRDAMVLTTMRVELATCIQWGV